EHADRYGDRGPGEDERKDPHAGDVTDRPWPSLRPESIASWPPDVPPALRSRRFRVRAHTQRTRPRLQSRTFASRASSHRGGQRRVWPRCSHGAGPSNPPTGRSSRVHEPDPGTVRAAADGDPVAFEELVRAYQAQVWRFLRHLLGDAALAEDVTQETFLRVFQRLQTFRYRSRFSTWVFQVARNAGVDALRARARQERLARLVPPPSVVAGADSGADIVAALSCLSVRLRESLLLVEVLGLRYREVAQVLGVPEGTVKSRVAQARQRMAAWLAVGERADEM